MTTEGANIRHNGGKALLVTPPKVSVREIPLLELRAVVEREVSKGCLERANQTILPSALKQLDLELRELLDVGAPDGADDHPGQVLVLDIVHLSALHLGAEATDGVTNVDQGGLEEEQRLRLSHLTAPGVHNFLHLHKILRLIQVVV
jgi:hypothetical protein